MSVEDPLNYNNLDIRLDLDDINRWNTWGIKFYIWNSSGSKWIVSKNEKISKMTNLIIFQLKNKSKINENLKFVKHWK